MGSARCGDKISQRQLLLELRNAIDAARLVRYFNWSNEPLAAMLDVRRLVEQNPVGCRSKYVRHNLARSRNEWLGPLFEELMQDNKQPPVQPKDLRGGPKTEPRHIKGTIEPTKKG